MSKKYFMIAIAALVIFAGSSSHADIIKTQDAKDYVQKLSDKVVAVIQSKATDDAKEKQLVAMFDENVDTDFMAKFAMGSNFRTATPEQKKRYLSLYKDYVIFSYIPRFRMYSGESLNVTQVIKEDDGYFIAKTTLATEKSATGTVLVDYKLKKTDGSFKLVDIIGEGISLITNHRSDFSAALANGDLDGFLNKLDQKVQNLKARSRDKKFIEEQYKKAGKKTDDKAS